MILRCSLSALYVLFSCLCIGQIDSLFQMARNQKAVNTEEARQTLSLIKTQLTNPSEVRLAELYLLEAEILFEENDESGGLEFINNAQELFIADEDKVRVLDALYHHYSRTAQYAKALEYIFQAIEIREANGDKKGLANNFIDLADTYWYQQRWQDCIDYAHQAVNLVGEDQPSEELAGGYKILSEGYLELNQYESALDYINRTISVKKSLGGDDLELASSINSRGNVYKYMERYEDAIQDYSSVLEACESIDYKVCMRVALANLGHVHLLNEEYAEAIPYKLRSLVIQRETGRVQQVPENLLHLSQAYEGVGDYASAYKYQLQLDSFKTVEHQQALDKLSNELSVKYETEKKEEAIQSLNDRVRLQRLSLLLGGLLLIISAVAALIFSRLNNALKTRNHEKEILLKEIHHRVKNNLQILSSLLNLQSEHLVDEAALDAIIEGKNRVESMGMIHQKLYTKDDLTAVDLKEYFYELCRYLEDSFSSSKRKIQIDEQVGFHNMDVDYAVPLGLITNELVTNAVKYAYPNETNGTVKINLQEENGHLVLAVSDEGKGQSPDFQSLSTSFGTQLITTLSKKLKGEIEISNDNGYQTVIRFARYRKN